MLHYNTEWKIKGVRYFFGEVCLLMIGFDWGLRVPWITAELWDADIGWN